MAVFPIESQGPVTVTNGNNVLFTPYEYNAATEAPQSFIHIYNIAPKEFHLAHPLFPKFYAPACPTGKRYVDVHSLRHPYPQFDVDAEGNPVTRSWHADRIAMDIVSPDNRTLDQNASIGETTSVGNNYNQQGLFWSRNNPPLESELKDAEKRLETFYRGLLEKATALEVSAPSRIPDTINADYHLAADYFGENYSWHKQRVAKKPEVAKSECPNCGEEIKAGAPYHFVEGVACVNDWKRAVESGIKKKSDVPEGREWWPVDPAVKELSKMVK
jgi:hypothetical protein